MAKSCKEIARKLSKGTSEEFLSDPLDGITILITTQSGVQKNVQAISIGFMEPRCYVAYKVIPCLLYPFEGNCNEAEAEEWFERMNIFEKNLKWLLKLTHQRFWCQVIFDVELHANLQSYLSCAPRDYDLNPSCREDILSCQKRVHKLVFFVFLRMSTYKESKLCHITPHVFAEIIYENYIFDVPRMMDLAVLYGFDNEQIMNKMIQSIITVQPCYLDDLEDSMLLAISSFDKVMERLNLKTVEEKTVPKLSDLDTTFLHSFQLLELFDVVSFITDLSATLYCFFEACPQASVAFYKCKGPLQICPFYDLIFPLLEKEMVHRLKSDESELYIKAITKKMVLAKTFLVKAFRNIVTSSCIHPVLNARCDKVDSSENSESFHMENYLHLFTEVATERIFLNDYNGLFPLSEDVELFSAADIPIDMDSLNYILSSLVNASPMQESSVPCDKANVNNVPSADKISNMQELAASLCSGNIVSQNGDSDFYANNASCAKPDDVQIVSLIQTILDVFPDFGEGFLEVCLEHYGYDCEKVIDALITDSLPPHLSSMDRNMKRKMQKATENVEIDSYLSGRKSIFDGDEFDVFNREDVALDKIHQGKSGKTPNDYRDLNTDKHSSMLKALTLKYEEQIELDEEKAREQMLMYEDEYDDTYDSHMFGLMEVQPENELLRLRPVKVPPALKSFKKEEKEEDEDDEEEESENEDTETSLQRDKEDFCMNPEIIRQEAERRRLAKAANFGKQRETSDQPSNYRNKERNKGRGANHNRRNQADYKHSRGMIPNR